jgi:hypothetical protein
MQVTAFNTPRDPGWRWRIVNYAGEMVAESDERYPSIHAAVTEGAKTLTAMDVVDRTHPVAWRRSTSHLRRP